MFTAILKVQMVSMNEAMFFHVRKNGEFIQKLRREDAILINEQHCSIYTWYDAFFIIPNAERGDYLKIEDQGNSKNNRYDIKPITSCDQSNLIEQSYWIGELCEILSEQEKEIPKILDEILKCAIPALFDEVIPSKGCQYAHSFHIGLSKKLPNGFDSADIWSCYIKALKSFGKTTTDYISQETIDRFMFSLLEKYQLAQFTFFYNTCDIEQKPKLVYGYKEAEQTLSMIFNRVMKVLKDFPNENSPIRPPSDNCNEEHYSTFLDGRHPWIEIDVVPKFCMNMHRGEYRIDKIIVSVCKNSRSKPMAQFDISYSVNGGGRDPSRAMRPSSEELWNSQLAVNGLLYNIQVRGRELYYIQVREQYKMLEEDFDRSLDRWF